MKLVVEYRYNNLHYTKDYDTNRSYGDVRTLLGHNNTIRIHHGLVNISRRIREMRYENGGSLRLIVV